MRTVLMALAAAGALGIGPAAQEDREAGLVRQSVDRIGASAWGMAFEMGRCSHIYPTASLNPYVVRARQDIASLGMESLTFAVDRATSLAFAEGLQEAEAHRATVTECAGAIEAHAKDIEQHVAGFTGLLRAMAQSAP